MKKKDNRPIDSPSSSNIVRLPPKKSPQTLRHQAEEILRKKVAVPSAEQEILSYENARNMFYELQVHQIELEMQNEELRRTHAELEIVRERYFDLYDLAPVGYCTLSEKGLFLEVNLTAATLLGAPRGALVRQPISRFIFNEDQEIYYFHRKQLFQTGESQTCELRMLKMDGTLFWTTLIAIAAKDDDGAPVCRIVMNDIAEHKKEQEEKAKLEIQLKKAQRMKSVGRLAGGVAHDFNNMLGVILGYIEMNLDQDSPVLPFSNDLEEMRKAAERCADLTRQLLAFASMQIVAPKVLDLNHTVKEMFKVLRPAISENIELVWQPGADLWPISMDSVQLDQMLTTLCDNAREAIVDMGRIVIKTENIILDEKCCTGHPWLIPGNYVQLTVSDNGRGIDKELIDNLFEPFYSTKEMGTGTGTGTGAGLGLATVYGAIKQNGGFIDVTSDRSQGTTFIIYFPRHEVEEWRVPAVDFVQNATPIQKTILLVDDEPSVLEMITRLLEITGYTVLATNDAHEAISLAREHAGKINLLLTDVVMPAMNGEDLARKLITNDPSLKCLFMSGYTSEIMTHGGLLNKNIHFIQKPFAIDDLITKVEYALKT